MALDRGQENEGQQGKNAKPCQQRIDDIGPDGTPIRNGFHRSPCLQRPADSINHQHAEDAEQGEIHPFQHFIGDIHHVRGIKHRLQQGFENPACQLGVKIIKGLEHGLASAFRGQGREAEAFCLQTHQHIFQHIGIGFLPAAYPPMHDQDLTITDVSKRLFAE